MVRHDGTVYFRGDGQRSVRRATHVTAGLPMPSWSLEVEGAADSTATASEGVARRCGRVTMAQACRRGLSEPGQHVL